MAFLLPALEHIRKKGDQVTHSTNENAFERRQEYYQQISFAPTVLIISPTRELAIQIHSVLRNVAPSIYSTCVYGGVVSQFTSKTQICVGTVGRIMDLIRKNHLKLTQSTYLVIDECDQMTGSSQIEDLKWIIQKMPSDVQALMFSATWASSVQDLASSISDDVLRLVIEAPKEQQNVDEKFIVCNPTKKDERLRDILIQIRSSDNSGKIIIFANQKRTVGIVKMLLREFGFAVLQLLGSMNQKLRTSILSRFRSETGTILVATDVAARGLDIEKLDYVINYDMPLNITGYIHRIGRCGRQKQRGTVYTLMEDPYPEGYHNVLRDLRAYLRKKKYPIDSDLERLFAYE